jgi:hypothetical protein
VLAGGRDRARITQLQDDIRAAMTRLEIVAGEAHQERRTYLTHEFDPDPLVRAVLRRLRRLRRLRLLFLDWTCPSLLIAETPAAFLRTGVG